MAYQPSYSDFEKALKDSGLEQEFSSYDLELARAFPEFGLTAISLKQDWHNSGSEGKKLANSMLNRQRSLYGGYTGGSDGSRYYADEPTDSFRFSEAPAYRGSSYQKQAGSLAEELRSTAPFRYDPETDPNWSAYRKQYRREGERATADALGKASAATGGLPSSWAVTAATQAGDYYAAQLSDRLPDLYQQAYERWLGDYERKLGLLDSVTELAERDYQQYRDRYEDWEQERDFAYDLWLDEQERQRQSFSSYSAAQSEAAAAEAADTTAAAHEEEPAKAPAPARETVQRRDAQPAAAEVPAAPEPEEASLAALAGMEAELDKILVRGSLSPERKLEQAAGKLLGWCRSGRLSPEQAVSMAGDLDDALARRLRSLLEAQ